VGIGVFVTRALSLAARAWGGAEAPVGANPTWEFGAVLLGAFVAARLGGRVGVAHGLAVAVGFILLGTLFQSIEEARMASTQGPDALPPLNLLSLMIYDVVYLTAGFLGGLAARTGGLRQ
jgi:hypothetical protein